MADSQNTTSVRDRLLLRISKHPSGCWIWNGAKGRAGYGVLQFQGAQRQAHRVALEVLANREIPVGMVVDHICRNRACINPLHLRIVTRSVNSLENSIGPAAINSRKTHCPKGHELSARIYLKPNGRTRRRCKVCEYAARAVKAQKAAAARWKDKK